MKELFALRTLRITDAPFMLEWMHDDSVTHDLQNNFAEKTLEDCLCFIERALDNHDDLHLAIVNQHDEYMGTVSLKHITDTNAEFAITVRKKAMGSGCSGWAMRRIIEKALHEMNLQEVYWCVSPANKRALRFYDKNRYERVNFRELTVTKQECMRAYSEQQLQEYIWYHVLQ
ncbi:diamine N-acetyltransferase [Selenomonas sp. WCT3]|uniref:GNAT family N-acetyltransferase n=1 Tax=Selenomonas sp. WCT3 TaxID=3158785 RepID=UPI000881DDC3|nr:diamine N-acetyltransferase [Selenomonas ruminantium]